MPGRRRAAKNRITYVDDDPFESGEEDGEYSSPLDHDEKKGKRMELLDEDDDYQPEEENGQKEGEKALIPTSDEEDGPSDDDFDHASPPKGKKRKNRDKKTVVKGNENKPNKTGKEKTVPTAGSKSSKTKQSTAKVSPKDVQDRVTAYVLKSNRPYSAINVFDNLHRTIPKPAIIKALDEAVEEGYVTSKTYGKSKIYYANQANLSALSNEEFDALETEIKTLEQQSQELSETCKRMESKLHAINSALSDEALQERLLILHDEEKRLDEELLRRKDDPEPMDPAAKKRLEQQLNRYQQAWRKRKRIVMDAVDTISESMEKSRHAVFEMCELETDHTP